MKDPYLSYLECRDRRHYTRFVTEYLDVMSRFAHRVVSRPEIADDAVQEAFLRLAETKLGAGDIASPRAYVLRTVLNVARNMVRDEGVRHLKEKQAAEERAGTQAGVADELIARESVHRLYRAIDRLDGESRLAIHLRAVEGLTYAEIADVTSVSAGTVATRIRRARRELKRLLGSTVAATASTSLHGAREAGVLPVATRELQERIAVVFLSNLGIPGGIAHEPIRQRLNVGSRLGSPARRGLLIFAAGLSVVSTVGIAVRRAPDPGSGPVASSVAQDTASPQGARAMKPPTRSSQQVSTALAVTIGLLVTPHADAKPGDLVRVLPSQAPGPVDLTYDPGTDTYWVTSGSEHLVYRYSADLTQVLGTLPLPFENPTLSLSYGIAFNPLERTLLIVDAAFEDKIHEIDTDGTPTGLVIDPGHRDTMGLAFDPAGDGGEGSVFVVLNETAVVNEITLAGELLRSFPEQGELRAVLGGDAAIHLNDVDPIYRGDVVDGFWLLANTDQRYAVLRLDGDGRPTGERLSLWQAGGEVNGLLRRPFPDRGTGQDFDAFVCSTVVDSRFMVFEAGEPEFFPIFGLACDQTDRAVSLTWTRGQTYEAIEVFHGCEILEVLSGQASSWNHRFEADGVYHVAVRAISGFHRSETEPCTIVVGAGQLVHSVQVDEPSRGPAFLAVGEEGTVILAGAGSLFRFDEALRLIGRAPVSHFLLPPNGALRGVASGGEPETLYVYEGSRHTVGRLDYSGDLLSSFEAKLPDIRTDPAGERDRGLVEAMTFDPDGDEGRGTLWVVETKRHRLYELDLAGKVLREIEHPYADLDHPDPGGVDPLAGISMVRGGDSREVYLSGWFAGQQRELFRFGLDREEIVPGSAVPLVGVRDPKFAHVQAPNGPRLFVYDHATLHEVAVRSPAVAAPGFLVCRQSTHVDQVELEFRANGAYDEIEVHRDCELIAKVGGATESFLDDDVTPGLHEYAVRGISHGVASDFTQCSVRVGSGAILQRDLSGPLDNPGQIAWNPLDGSFFLTSARSAGGGRREVFHFDADLRFLESFEPEFSERWEIETLAVRVPPGGEPLLYLIRTTGAVNSPFGLATHTLDGRFVDSVEISVPRGPSVGGFRWTVGLTWDPKSDTFYFMEARFDTFAQMDPGGEILRTFPHPAPPPNSFVFNDGLCILPERGTLWTTTAGIEDLENDRYTPTRVVEMRLDGTLTGSEIPLPTETVLTRGIAIVGSELICASSRGGGQIIRLKAFEEPPSPPVPVFLRGDSNADGKVDVSDPTHILRHLFSGGEEPSCLDSADSNDDGAVNVADAVYVLHFLFGGGEPPPPPYPETAADPTADGLGC